MELGPLFFLVMKILWQKKKSSRVVQEQLTLSLLSFVWGDSYWTPSLFFFIMTVPIILGCLDVPLFVEHDHSKQEELWVEWKSTDESSSRLPVHSEERALVKGAPLQLYAKHVLENTTADKKKKFWQLWSHSWWQTRKGAPCYTELP